MQIKNYLIYICCSTFTFLGIYLLIDSFVDPDLELSGNYLLKERVKYCNFILFFGGIGYVYYILENYGKTYNGNFAKVNFSLLLGSLIFIINSLFLILHPETFTKGSKLFKLIIGYTGLIFFGLGFISSIVFLLRKKEKY